MNPRAPDSVGLWRCGHVAFTLALIAGYVDAYALLTYKVYVSFFSGNTTQAGLSLGHANPADAGARLLPILAFLGGVFGATLLLHSQLARPKRWTCFLVAALLVTAAATSGIAGAIATCAVAFLGLAMGALNTVLPKVGAQSVSLGFVTRDLFNVAQQLALAVKHMPVPDAEGEWDTPGRRAALLASVWLAFLTGAFLSATAAPALGAWTLLPPATAVVLLGLFSLGKPLPSHPNERAPSSPRDVGLNPSSVE